MFMKYDWLRNGNSTVFFFVTDRLSHRKCGVLFFQPMILPKDGFQFFYWITNCVAFRQGQLHFQECGSVASSYVRSIDEITARDIMSFMGNKNVNVIFF